MAGCGEDLSKRISVVNEINPLSGPDDLQEVVLKRDEDAHFSSCLHVSMKKCAFCTLYIYLTRCVTQLSYVLNCSKAGHFFLFLMFLVIMMAIMLKADLRDGICRSVFSRSYQLPLKPFEAQTSA